MVVRQKVLDFSSGGMSQYEPLGPHILQIFMATGYAHL